MASNKTLSKHFGALRGIQYDWNLHVGYGWMHETMKPKLNFIYNVEDIIADGIFTDANKNKVVENVTDKLKTWYCGKIHEKVTAMVITILLVMG